MNLFPDDAGANICFVRLFVKSWMQIASSCDDKLFVVYQNQYLSEPAGDIRLFIN